MSQFIRAARRLAGVVAAIFVASGLFASGAGAASELTIEPEAVDFGVHLPGGGDQRSVTVRNLGPDPVEFSDIYLVGDVDPFYFAGGTCPETGTFSGECQLTLEFAPDVAGDFEALLVVEGGPEDEPATATLTAKSRPPGQLVPSVPMVDFGEVPLGTTSAPRTVRLHNDGGISIRIDAIYANGAIMVDNGCGGFRVVAPLGSCDVTVALRPYAGLVNRERALQAGSLSIRGIAWDQIPPRRLSLEVPLRGTAVAASGQPLPSLPELARRIDDDLGGIARQSIRVRRGRLVKPADVSELRAVPFGLFGLEIQARVGKRWRLLARASAQVRSEAVFRPALRWVKSSRRLLTGVRPIRVRAVARYRASDRAIVESASARASVRPFKPKRR